jgi:hypothetical protein
MRWRVFPWNARNCSPRWDEDLTECQCWDISLKIVLTTGPVNDTTAKFLSIIQNINWFNCCGCGKAIDPSWSNESADAVRFVNLEAKTFLIFQTSHWAEDSGAPHGGNCCVFNCRQGNTAEIQLWYLEDWQWAWCACTKKTKINV